MTDEQPTYNQFVNPDPTDNQSSQPETNPWLFVMTGIGIASFIIGLALYDNAAEGLGDVAMRVLWALVLMGFGVTLLVSAMASAAICWQLRRSHPSS